MGGKENKGFLDFYQKADLAGQTQQILDSVMVCKDKL